MPKTTEQKDAAVWQPLPSLLRRSHQAFVRVQDERGQTSHFAPWSCKRLNEGAVEAVAASAINRTAPESLLSGVEHPSQHEAGSASGDQNDTALLAAASETLSRQAYERGIEEGRHIQAAEQAAHIETLVEERRSADQQRALQLLDDIKSGIAGLREQPERLHEPLQRLALHIAEELTLVELSLSTRAIEQLIQRCLEVLDAPTSSAVLIELNPQDLALLQTQAQTPLAGPWRLQAQPEFMPGSVRVSADDASVTDLVEDRLTRIAQTLLHDLQPWQSQSRFDPQRHHSRLAQTPVQDVTPRGTEATPAAPNTAGNADTHSPQAHASREEDPDYGL